MRVGVMCPDPGINGGALRDAVGMYEALKKKGVEVYFFLGAPGPAGRSSVQASVHEYADADWILGKPDDLLIYHVSAADRPALRIMRRLKCRLALRCHAVAPGGFAMAYSIQVAAENRHARRMLGAFVSLPIRFVVSTSVAVRAEPALAGFPAVRSHVLAPFHDAEGLVIESEDLAVAIAMRQDAINILAVGDIAPQAGVLQMIDALSLLRGQGLGPVRLRVVGSFDKRLAGYWDLLVAAIESNGLEDWVTLEGECGPQELATYYRNSDLFWSATLCPSADEPVIAAVAFGLPVMTTSQGALSCAAEGVTAIADTPAEMAMRIRQLIAETPGVFADPARLRETARALSKREIESQFFDILERHQTPPAVRDEATDGDWFFLPQTDVVRRLVKRLLPGEDLHTEGFRRSAVLNLLQSRSGDRSLVRYLSSQALRDYAAAIAMPGPGRKLSAAARLVWFFSTYAQEVFTLGTEESVEGFLRWYMRGAFPNLAPLMSAFDQRGFAGDAAGVTRPASCV